jgi:ActR/RegA family two-component response regulator
MKDARPATEVIVVTGYGTVARAVEATKAGAFILSKSLSISSRCTRSSKSP